MSFFKQGEYDLPSVTEATLDTDLELAHTDQTLGACGESLEHVLNI